MTSRAAPISEAAFMAQVTQLAELLGWEWMHPRAGRTVDSWRTPMSGTMARGWPDLVLVRVRDRRLIFAELKRDGGKLSPDQERVMNVLRELIETVAFPAEGGRLNVRWGQRIEVAVWWPTDWDAIEAKLR